MKKILIILIALIFWGLIGVGVYFSFFNKTEEITIKLPFEKDDGKLLGIMYIGGLEEDYDYTIVEKFLLIGGNEYGNIITKKRY